MKTLDLSGFAFGEGAFVEDGVPVNITFSNCEGTFWVRALDGNMMADLAAEGVDLTPLFQQKKDNPDEVELKPEVAGLESDALKLVQKNRKQQRIIVNRLVSRFEGLKRSDGTPIPFNEDTLTGLAGYPMVVVMIIIAAVQVAMELAGNSESSSDGNDTPTTQPDGELTSETVEPEA